MSARAAKLTTPFDRIPKQIERARVQVRRLTEDTMEQALELIPAGSKKAIKEMSVRVEKATHNFQKQSERAMKDMNDRRRKLLSTMEKRANEIIQPLVERFSVASRADVERLHKRLSDLEKKVQHQQRRVAA